MPISCTHCWISHVQDQHRMGIPTGCPTCRVTFYSKSAFRRHRADPTSSCGARAVSEFRCLDCDLEFRSARALDSHLAWSHSNPREPPPDRRGIHYCGECRKSFETSTGLKSHREHARVHKPLLARKVDCVGGCKKTFDAPSSLLAHLESGVCKSGITRDKLDRAIIAEDKTNVITDLDAVLARQTRNLSLTNSDISSICGGPVFDTPDDLSDAASTSAQSETFDGLPRYDPAGGVLLTPGGFSNEAFSSSAGSGVYTPRGSSTGTATPIAGVSGGGGILINSPSFSAASFSTTGNPYTPSTSSIASNQPVAEPTIDQLRSWLLPDGTFECPNCPDPPDPTTTKPSFLTFAELRAHMRSPTAHPQLNNNLNFTDPHDLPISSASSESGIATPSTIPAHPYLLPGGEYECPLCPLGSRKRFRLLAALQTHMLSPIAHMPNIYHCPDPALLGIVLPPGTKSKKQKSFATLSALAQHVESSACQGGGLMFKAMVGFVNEKLGNLGMGDRRMIAAE
ncbi:unnamed protein product [Tuber melanosporum]|uniref:(Perigord truffle) hypothetical protein n=1 Tax=Tuber melanosporum (strain Mel28) TaxID=656061 RepID=D5GGV0_TUBMM|nr:uncharacterized protein GSTUM_00007522001 [Tuber melanosporum]CAZ83722.1 unnamed protein product [Tuber melanosporum]